MNITENNVIESAPEMEAEMEVTEAPVEEVVEEPTGKKAITALQDFSELFMQLNYALRERFPYVSIRNNEWVGFGQIVDMHIHDYTVPQYGDYPNDQVAKWDINTIMNSIGKYVNRFQTNARGEEENLLDLVKIAHYACMGYMKLRGYTELFLPVEESPIEEPAGEAPQMESSDTEEASVSA